MEDESWILRPQLAVINGRQYRKNYPAQAVPEEVAAVQEEERANFTAEDLGGDAEEGWYEDEAAAPQAELDMVVRELEAGCFAADIQADASLFGKVIGRQGATKARIEKETGATINIPRSAQRSGPSSLRVLAKSRGALDACIAALRPILLGADKKPQKKGAANGGSGRKTHFLAIPLHSSSLEKSIPEFRARVPDPEGCGISEEMFAPASRLHLTLCTLSIGKDSVHKASSVLKSSVASARAKGILPTGPGNILVKGVQYMNDDPSEIDVLYAKVQLDSGQYSLQAIADYFVDEFVKAGLTEKQYEKVKLHATIINSKWRRGSDTRTPFDGRAIMDGSLRDFDFGVCALDTLHLCEMKRSSDGYYEVADAVSLK